MANNPPEPGQSIGERLKNLERTAAMQGSSIHRLEKAIENLELGLRNMVRVSLDTVCSGWPGLDMLGFDALRP